MNLRDSLKSLVKEDAIYFEPCVTRYRPIKDANGNLVTVRSSNYYLDTLSSTVTVEPINRVGFPNESPYPNYIYDVEYSPALEPAEEGTEVLVAFTNTGKGYIVSSSKIKTFTAEEYRITASSLATAREKYPNLEFGDKINDNTEGFIILDGDGFSIDLKNQDGYFVLYEDGLYNFESLKVHFKSKYGVLVNLGGGSDADNLDCIVPPTGIVRIAKSVQPIKSSVFRTDTTSTSIDTAIPVVKIPLVKEAFKTSIPEIVRITEVVLFNEDIANFNRTESLRRLIDIEITIKSSEGLKLLNIIKSYLTNTTTSDSNIISNIYNNITRSYTNCYEPILLSEKTKYLTKECKEEMVSIMQTIATDSERIIKLGGHKADARLIPLKPLKYMEDNINRKERDNSFNAVLRKLGSLRFGIVYLQGLANVALKEDDVFSALTPDKKWYETVASILGWTTVGLASALIAAPVVMSAMGFSAASAMGIAGAADTALFLNAGSGVYWTAAGVSTVAGSVGAGGGAGSYIIYGIVTNNSTDKTKQVAKSVKVPEKSTRRTFELINVLVDLLSKNPPIDMVPSIVKAEELAKRNIEVSVSLLSVIEQLTATIQEFSNSLNDVLSVPIPVNISAATATINPISLTNTKTAVDNNIGNLKEITKALLGTQSDYNKGAF